MKDSSINSRKSLNKKYFAIILSIMVIIVSVFMVILVRNNFNTKKNDENKDTNNTLNSVINNNNSHYTQNFGSFSVDIPKDFLVMSDEEIKLKYQIENLPTQAYVNENKTINLAFYIKNEIVQNSEIEEYVRVMEHSYKQFVDEINVVFLEKAEHKIGVLEFVKSASSDEKYNYEIVFSDNGNLRIISLNCDIEYKNECKSFGDIITNSINF